MIKEFQSSLWSYILCPFGNRFGGPCVLWFQSSLWSYILCPNNLFNLKNVLSSNFNLLYEAIFYVLGGKDSTVMLSLVIFQSSLWSYILCPTTQKWVVPHFRLKFQSSLWSYILCPYQSKEDADLIYIKFQSSLWSYILCPVLSPALTEFELTISIFFMKLYSMS